jgi:hypothetical protein
VDFSGAGERVTGSNGHGQLVGLGPAAAAWLIRARQGYMIYVWEARGGRGRVKTLAVQGFSVERVPGIERAWPACRSDPGRGGGVHAWYIRPR